MSERNTFSRRKRAQGIAPGASVEASGIATRGAPTDAEIRHRAHEIYLNRAGGCGDALGDWLLAELELRSRARRPLPGNPP